MARRRKHRPKTHGAKAPKAGPPTPKETREREEARQKATRERQARRLPPEAPAFERLSHDEHVIEPNIAGPHAPRVWRALDTVEMMRRKGSIGEAQLQASRIFQEDFQLAGLTLKAQSYERLDPSVGGDERRLDARRRIGRAMDKLGGHGSLLGQVCWFVLGVGMTLAECAQRLEWSGGSVDRKALGGVLIAALDLLSR